MISAKEIARYVRSLGLEAEIGGRGDVVNCRTPWLGASFYTHEADRIISWYGAARPLRAGLAGAWAIGDVNRAHRRKATSFPSDEEALLTALGIGLLASLDGSCFDDIQR